MNTLTNHGPEFRVQITKIAKRKHAAGTQVSGRINSYRFDALVFAEHAENADYELGTSQISKLWIQRLEDDTTVFNFDRGLDIGPANAEVAWMVQVLCDRLAGLVFSNGN